MTSRSISNQPDSARSSAQAESGQWTEHEHVSGEAQREAQKLVNAAGSAEIAKHAVEQAAEPVATSAEAPGSREEFAKKLGFISYLDLFEASTPVTAADGSAWLVTASGPSVWIAWNERELDGTRRYGTREEATEAVRSGQAGSGITGPK